MEKNRETVREEYHKSLAAIFGVPDYSVWENADDRQRQKIIARARKIRKIKPVPASNITHSGNPYIMLGRKINAKGKTVK